MDMEKYVNSKVYTFFEWIFKLIVWNTFTILLLAIPLILPIFLFTKYIDFDVLVESGFSSLSQNAILSLISMLIGLMISTFIFIPCYITVFRNIKIFHEDRKSNTITTYFYVLWDTIKNIYKIELVIIPIQYLFIFAIFIYSIIVGTIDFSINYITVWYVIGINVLSLCLIALFLCFLNVPMAIAYFRMKPKTILRFTLIITFKQFINTLIYAILLLLPVVICVFAQFMIPLWLLFGFSFPLYIMYFISSSKYRILLHNIETVREDDIYNLKGEKNETRN